MGIIYFCTIYWQFIGLTSKYYFHISLQLCNAIMIIDSEIPSTTSTKNSVSITLASGGMSTPVVVKMSASPGGPPAVPKSAPAASGRTGSRGRRKKEEKPPPMAGPGSKVVALPFHVKRHIKSTQWGPTNRFDLDFNTTSKKKLPEEVNLWLDLYWRSHSLSVCLLVVDLVNSLWRRSVMHISLFLHHSKDNAWVR